MPRKPIGERAMTDAERQARYRVARATGAPVIRIRRPADHRSRAKRWDDDVASLVKAQIEYAAWLDSLPDSLQDSATAEGVASDLRTRPQRTSGNRSATRLRTGLTFLLTGLTHVMHKGPPAPSAPRNALGRCATGAGPSYALRG